MATFARAAPSFRLRTESLNTLRLRRVFDIFDDNSDGLITLDELSLALTRLGLSTDLSDLTTSISEYIPEGQEGLAFDDFSALHRALGDALFGCEENEGAQIEDDGDLREAFRVFDEDGDGFISAVELQTVLKKLGLKEGGSMVKVKEMICSVDLNSDGQVDFGEFKTMMKEITVLGA